MSGVDLFALSFAKRPPLNLADLEPWLIYRDRALTCTHCGRTASVRLRRFIDVHRRCNGEAL